MQQAGPPRRDTRRDYILLALVAVGLVVAGIWIGARQDGGEAPADLASPTVVVTLPAATEPGE